MPKSANIPVILSSAKDLRAKHNAAEHPFCPAGSGFAEGFFAALRMTGFSAGRG